MAAASECAAAFAWLNPSDASLATNAKSTANVTPMIEKIAAYSIIVPTPELNRHEAVAASSRDTAPKAARITRRNPTYESGYQSGFSGSSAAIAAEVMRGRVPTRAVAQQERADYSTTLPLW